MWTIPISSSFLMEQSGIISEGKANVTLEELNSAIGKALAAIYYSGERI